MPKRVTHRGATTFEDIRKEPLAPSRVLVIVPRFQRNSFIDVIGRRLKAKTGVGANAPS